jgi:hypothetical protein
VHLVEHYPSQLRAAAFSDSIDLCAEGESREVEVDSVQV